VALFERATAIFVPAATIGELEAAFLRGSRPRENQRALDSFLDEPLVREVPLDRKVARRFGALFASLRAARKPIPINDIWIAAATLEVGARLVTFDGDFERVEGLSLELLQPPSA
jgi:tRNA(fMet)-specific endonuclease VapC